MNDKEKEELNRWCHTVLLGKCWHSRHFWREKNWCPNCSPIPTEGGIYVSHVPDYCSSLDLASIVEAKAIERVGEVHMADCLHNICSHEYFARFAENKLIEWHPWAAIAFASAETRCKAARAVVEGEA